MLLPFDDEVGVGKAGFLTPQGSRLIPLDCRFGAAGEHHVQTADHFIAAILSFGPRG